MKWTAVGLALVALALPATLANVRSARAADAAAAEEPGAVTSDTCVGRIHAVDAEAHTITIRHKKENTTFTVADDCRFVGYDKEDVTLADLKVGDRARVSWAQDGDSQVAHRIEHAVTKNKRPAG